MNISPIFQKTNERIKLKERCESRNAYTTLRVWFSSLSIKNLKFSLAKNLCRHKEFSYGNKNFIAIIINV